MCFGKHPRIGASNFTKAEATPSSTRSCDFLPSVCTSRNLHRPARTSSCGLASMMNTLTYLGAFATRETGTWWPSLGWLWGSSQTEPTKACLACTEHLAPTLFPEPIHSDPAAVHANDICVDCWHQHVRTAIDDPSRVQIGCAACPLLLQEHEVRLLATKDDHTRYTDKLSLNFIKEDPDYRECPSATCSYGYIHLARHEGNIFRCAVCQARYCLDCEEVMHDGVTCRWRRNRRDKAKKAGEKATTTYLKANSKACPGCGAHIEKDGGCDHMTCRYCKYEFCWVCSAPYGGDEGIWRGGNRAHGRKCRHYRPV